MSSTWDHVETNRPQSDLATTSVTDCTFESIVPISLLPDTFDAEDFNEVDFIYNNFGFVNPGSGSAEWIADDYNYGIYGSLRAGIGFFYFYTTNVIPTNFDAVGDDGCFEEDFVPVKFWDYISTFWNLLEDSSREMIENLWYGMVIAGGSLSKKASRFEAAIAPTTINVCAFDDFYDLQVSLLLSKPVLFDPTLKSPRTIINPLRTILVEPTYVEYSPVFNDLIEITADDYYKIRGLGTRLPTKIGSGCYVVVQPKNTSIETKYFLVTDFYSSEEPCDRPASAFINNTLVNSVPSSEEIALMGSLKIVGTNISDISQYKISIGYSAGAATVAWSSTSLGITVDRTSASQISDILDASATGTPWATISNTSSPGKAGAPIISNLDFEDLYNYVNAQTGSARYYQDGGKVWKWYGGWPTDTSESPGNILHGEWVASKSKYKYMIEISGSLEYLGSETFSIYLTTGKAYNINKEIIDIPYLTTGIDVEGVYFKKDIDYTFISGVVEFIDDIFINKNINAGTYLYCKKAPSIEQYLFEQYGGMIGINDWTQYNYRNISGKAGLNTAISSFYNISSIVEYEKAMNVYYGLPIAPEKSRVIGLFESYGYKVTNIVGLQVTIELKSEMHPFIQIGCTMLNSAGKQFKISNISNGIITFNSVDGISYGDRLYVKLNNKMIINGIYAGSGYTAPYIDVEVEDYRPILHVINTVYELYNKYPELIIHGTNYDGLYHATNIERLPESGKARITLYQPKRGEEPMYNDYIGTTLSLDKVGYAHFPWPTHKFLYLEGVDSKKLYRAYIDSPMDTIYDSGDFLEQYSVICRNASVLNGKLFSAWNQYYNFRRSPSINIGSDIIEMIFADPSSQFGKYFPSSITAATVVDTEVIHPSPSVTLYLRTSENEYPNIDPALQFNSIGELNTYLAGDTTNHIIVYIEGGVDFPGSLSLNNRGTKTVRIQTDPSESGPAGIIYSTSLVDDASLQDSVRFENLKIYSNDERTSDYLLGAGAVTSKIIFINCIIQANKDSLVNSSCTIEIINSIVLYFNGGSSSIIYLAKNSLTGHINFNSIFLIDDGSAIFQMNDGVLDDYINNGLTYNVAGGTFDINAPGRIRGVLENTDPLFSEIEGNWSGSLVSEIMVSNFKPTINSPAINAGNNGDQWSEYNIITDIVGNDRIFKFINVDIGPYEIEMKIIDIYNTDIRTVDQIKIDIDRINKRLLNNNVIYNGIYEIFQHDQGLMEEFVREEKIAIKLNEAEKEYELNTDKTMQLLATFEAYYDSPTKTILVKKVDGEASAMLGKILEDDSYILHFNDQEHKLYLFFNEVATMGMSGSKNIIKNVRFGGNPVF